MGIGRREFLASLASCVSAQALSQALVVSPCGAPTIAVGGLSNWTTDPNGGACTSAGVSSFSVWNPADAAANGMTLSNGGLTVTPQSAAAWKSIRTTIAQSSGKRYIEFITSANATSSEVFGASSSGFISSGLLGSSNYSGGVPLNSAPTQVSSQVYR